MDREHDLQRLDNMPRVDDPPASRHRVVLGVAWVVREMGDAVRVRDRRGGRE